MSTRTPFSRGAAAVVVVLAAAFVVAACSPGGPAEVTASLRSEPRPGPELDPGSPDPSTGSGGDVGDLQDELQDLLPPDVSVPELDQLGECADLAGAYAELIALAFTGDPDGRIDDVLDELTAAMPAELDDDLEVIRSTLDEAAGGDLLDATSALSSPEFRDATANVTSWLAEQCNADGGA